LTATLLFETTWQGRSSWRNESPTRETAIVLVVVLVTALFKFVNCYVQLELELQVVTSGCHQNTALEVTVHSTSKSWTKLPASSLSELRHPKTAVAPISYLGATNCGSTAL